MFNAYSFQRTICFENFTRYCKALRWEGGAVLSVNLALSRRWPYPYENARNLSVRTFECDGPARRVSKILSNLEKRAASLSAKSLDGGLE